MRHAIIAMGVAGALVLSTGVAAQTGDAKKLWKGWRDG